MCKKHKAWRSFIYKTRPNSTYQIDLLLDNGQKENPNTNNSFGKARNPIATILIDSIFFSNYYF